jgi:hypothetical protein
MTKREQPRPHRFRRVELIRAIKAAVDSGQKVTAVEFTKDGVMSLKLETPEPQTA